MCPSGRHGKNCSIVCPDGFFGQKCQNKCPSDCNNTCNKVSGSCPGQSQGNITPFAGINLYYYTLSFQISNIILIYRLNKFNFLRLHYRPCLIYRTQLRSCFCNICIVILCLSPKLYGLIL